MGSPGDNLLPAAEELFELALGSRGPLPTLLATGEFPLGWRDQFFACLNTCQKLSSTGNTIPRKAAAAAHAMSVYPSLRYITYLRMSKCKESREIELLIADVRVRCEMFLLAGLSPIPPI
jgi:hypothetical protein